jgi:hypothetical protein
MPPQTIRYGYTRQGPAIGALGADLAARSRTVSATSGAAGNVYQIKIEGALDADGVARQVLDLITRYDRRRAGVVLRGVTG